MFGDAAYLQSPLTLDHEMLDSVLDESRVGMAGASTHIGDAIGLSVKLFKNSNVKDKLLILLTDGNDTGSKVPPIDAAKVAHLYGVKIYTLAVGNPENIGEDRIDTRTLNSISKLSGGEYFQAIDKSQLMQAYDVINKLEPSKVRVDKYVPKTDVFYIPLMIVICGNLIMYYIFFVLTRMGRYNV